MTPISGVDILQGPRNFVLFQRYHGLSQESPKGVPGGVDPFGPWNRSRTFLHPPFHGGHVGQQNGSDKIEDHYHDPCRGVKGVEKLIHCPK